jgi:hypothetical protein
MPLRSRIYESDQALFYCQIVAGFDPFYFDPYWLVLSDR